MLPSETKVLSQHHRCHTSHPAAENEAAVLRALWRPRDSGAWFGGEGTRDVPLPLVILLLIHPMACFNLPF